MFKKLILIGVFITGCAAPSSNHMSLTEAKRVDKLMKSDWRQDYIYICDTYGGKRICGYEHRRDVARRLRMMQGGL
jgi:hypothetical protein